MGKLSFIRRVSLKILNQIDFLFSDSWFIRFKFYLYLGYWPNVKEPRTFNEKLQWLKLNTRQDIQTKLVDKIEVKKIVAEKIGNEYIIPTIGVYNSVDDIKISSLPDKFVLKCNHNSGGIIICSDKEKLDLKKSRKILSHKLKQNYFRVGREWPYKNVNPRILAEEFIDTRGTDLPDYKFFCFNGKVKCCLVCANRFDNGGVKMNFYDREWNLLPFTRHYDNIPYEIDKPIAYTKMIELAEVLSAEFTFVRVDFYAIGETVLFGEMTFFPGNGWSEFEPIEWDYKLGEWLKLPFENDGK